MSALHVEGLGAGYRGHPVIADLSLAPLEPGTVTALVGPNAAGKSTLLKAIAGLVAATGSVRLGATELLALTGPERATRVGYLPQNLPAATGLTVLEGVLAAFRASGSGTRGGEATRRAMLALDRLDVADLAAGSLGRLSGGQRQMVGLAAALVREPPLLLLDEPTSALDLLHQIRVMEETRAVAATGRVVVMVLHDLALAARWADRVVVLHRGAVTVSAAPAAALTPATLAAVYGVSGRVEACSRGIPQVIVDGRLPPGEATGPRVSKGMP